jgi:hypothetical protein
MTNQLFPIFSDETIEECVITEDTVEEGRAPLTFHKNDRRRKLDTAM